MLAAIVAIGALAGAFAVLPAVAEAAISGVEIRTAEQRVSPDTTEAVEARCAPGEVTVGGGLRWINSVNLTANRVLGLDPAFPGGNRSTVHDYDVGGTDTAVSIAVCAPASEVPAITPRVSGEGVSTGEGVTVSCEAGEVALAGGVRPSALVASGERSISESQPTAIIDGGGSTSWRARYTNSQIATERFRAVALCAEGSFETEVARSARVPQPAGGLATATARCEGETVAIGGGVRWLPAGQVRNGLVASQPGGVVDGQPRSWVVTAIAPASAPAQELEAFAICAKLGDSTDPIDPVGASVSFASGPKLKVSRKGVAQPRLTCDAPAGERCQGALRVTGRKGKARRQIRASARFSIASSQTAGVRVALSRKATRLVRRAGPRGVRATATATVRGGSESSRVAIRLIGKR